MDLVLKDCIYELVKSFFTIACFFKLKFEHCMWMHVELLWTDMWEKFSKKTYFEHAYDNIAPCMHTCSYTYYYLLLFIIY